MATHSDSINLSPRLKENMKDDFLLQKSGLVDDFGRIVLSTKEQSIELDKDGLDDTILKNILYCYKFLDTTDKDYVNSTEAEIYIRHIKDENPQLFELLLDVLQVASEFSPNDTNIAKNLFINRLKTHIKNLKPDDKSPFCSLKSNTNAISNYFKNMDVNTRSSVSETVFEPSSVKQSSIQISNNPSIGDTYLNTVLSKITQESKETVFNMNSERNAGQTKEFSISQNPADELNSALDVSFNLFSFSLNYFQNDNSINSGSIQPQSDSVNTPVNKFENVNKFEGVDQVEKVLNTNSNVNEYLVFNYNTDLDWQHTLRDQIDLIFNI
ncbi:hypothetical protein MACJ_002009 [Theileria orientalis]|uniref:Uncharacterized protein n=1 Tax=Theileria orientalis TaxID=68886 RepID=A0A976M7T6_THEOR|nr:hypothetical protein MACJ_002009 [Theileria orientalis]